MRSCQSFSMGFWKTTIRHSMNCFSGNLTGNHVFFPVQRIQGMTTNGFQNINQLLDWHTCKREKVNLKPNWRFNCQNLARQRRSHHPKTFPQQLRNVWTWPPVSGNGSRVVEISTQRAIKSFGEDRESATNNDDEFWSYRYTANRYWVHMVYSYGCIYDICSGWWLSPPLWKIWVRQLGLWHSQLNGKMFQTTNLKVRIADSPSYHHGREVAARLL